MSELREGDIRTLYEPDYSEYTIHAAGRTENMDIGSSRGSVLNRTIGGPFDIT